MNSKIVRVGEILAFLGTSYIVSSVQRYGVSDIHVGKVGTYILPCHFHLLIALSLPILWLEHIWAEQANFYSQGLGHHRVCTAFQDFVQVSLRTTDHAI